MSALAYRFENVLNKLKRGELKCNSGMMDVMHSMITNLLRLDENCVSRCHGTSRRLYKQKNGALSRDAIFLALESNSGTDTLSGSQMFRILNLRLSVSCLS